MTDTGHNRVVKFSPEGQPLGAFGSAGSGPGQFQEPVAVAIAPNGDIYVSDTWNGRVQRFDAAFTPRGEIRIDGWSDRGVENKPYLAVAPDGTLYVTVPDAGGVLRFAADGRPLGTVATLEEGGVPGRALGVAVGREGQVWVTNAAGGTVVRLPGR